ncbi:putative alpha-glucosidase [Iris pallida]|uniref:Alpha-glucosidase n=1 Tax=Iris pallida TaxID=29817 RepID=A0AAX6H2A3_IRIPA|nr:putative alpha-glucosidase [Iris pallida]
MSLVHQRVKVREAVPESERLPGRPSHGLPNIELLPDRALVGVVPRKRIECTQLNPPPA